MSGAWLLVALLALAYFGSVTDSGSRIQSLTSHSGAVYLVLGFVLGSSVTGVLERVTVEDFRVVTQVGGSWLALVTGLGAKGTSRRVLGHATLGVALTLFVGLGVALVAWGLLGAFSSVSVFDRALFACGAGVLFAASAPPLVAQQSTDPGTGVPSVLAPLTRASLDVARATPLVPALALGALFAFSPAEGAVAFSGGLRWAATLATGFVLGVLAVLLLGREFRQNESWGLILGLSLLGGGAAVRVGLSAVAVSFVLGFTINVFSRHRDDIREMIAPTEKAVLLPVALLAGAMLDFALWSFGLAVALLASRLLLDLLRGAVLRWLIPATRPAGALYGLSLSMPGALTLAAGLELHQILPRALGGPFLLWAVISTVVGDAVSSLSARSSLSPERVGRSAPPDAPRGAEGAASS